MAAAPGRERLAFCWCRSHQCFPTWAIFALVFFLRNLASVCNHSFGLSLLTNLASPLPHPPSVVSSREHQKTNTMLRITKQRSTFSRQTKTNSLLRPELCFLNRGNKKKKTASMECDLWTHFLANSADFTQENSDTFFREEQQVFEETSTAPIGGFCKVHVSEFCLYCCIFI